MQIIIKNGRLVVVVDDQDDSVESKCLLLTGEEINEDYYNLTGSEDSILIGDIYSNLTGGPYSVLVGDSTSAFNGGNGAVFVARYYNHDKGEYRLVVATVGEDGIEEGVWYQINQQGEFVPAAAQE